MENIVFTNNVATELQDATNSTAREDIFVLTDCNTLKYCMPVIGELAFKETNVITIPANETSKNLESVSKVWLTLSQRLVRRNSLLINLGGGMICDLGGFAASCFKRGMRYINVPTTLLAQVDASVGGKTGINFNGLKNEIGVFSQAEAIIMDTVFFSTLDKRQILSGYGEMFKHALLAGCSDLKSLMEINPLHAENEFFRKPIKRSLEIKQSIVSKDPFEKGERKSLNFGHTAGHAIESFRIHENKDLYHGEAVAHGIIIELYLSIMKLNFDSQLCEEIKTYLRSIFNIDFNGINAESLYNLMLHDKKNTDDEVNFTLLSRVGEYKTDCYCSKKEIIDAIEHAK
ncbi:MAG: 3-dehydroquinate synthase [Culturomica sp.]|jgi:3-dehydroquinate synthase|nr:3-dehydroquinate synthase [Culturomica sp.]